MSTEPCKCREELMDKLKEEGLKFSNKVVGFAISNNKLGAHLFFPLQTLEGRKPKSGKPSYMRLSFCPFCGQKY